MELSLIRSLMDKTFYDEHRGAKCPDRLFSKDVRKIKQALDSAMTTYLLCKMIKDNKTTISSLEGDIDIH